MKFRLLFITISAALLLGVLTTTALAQGEPPAPYAGMKNPFPWDDASAQKAGKELYQRSCLGCHGANGSNIAQANFSDAEYSKNVPERADLYFWLLSEGRRDKGMPGYKSSLAEEQRWQVLTYLSSLGEAPSKEVTAPPAKPTITEKGTLLLTTPEEARAGQSLSLGILLKDSQGKPISDATVKFFIRMNFFASGLVEIGEAATNDQGTATFDYAPRQAGDIQVVARYEEGGFTMAETEKTVSMSDAAKSFYQSEAGIRLPAPGAEVFLGPQTAMELGEMGQAPMSALRLPAGILSWLLLLVGTVALIWVTYFRVIYQVFRIPAVSERQEIRLVPLAILIIVVILGTMLVLMLITGPYSHLHLHR